MPLDNDDDDASAADDHEEEEEDPSVHTKSRIQSTMVIYIVANVSRDLVYTQGRSRDVPQLGPYHPCRRLFCHEIIGCG